ncbi:MAG: thioredoxin domain-containing protein [Candidatus Microthrix sp.]|nr:thioredoxin domain-containing protein [Candidatus Microthrix sp.]
MANRLADSTSPYLRQHADNPVDWYQWGDQAFAAAADRDVPLLISIGYSSCHWCHVMAHESFEDPEVAAAMNRHFVNIKVDREERPDIDAVYMEATQTMTGRGGWPMTVLATPDGRPFYCGTYFPPEPRQGMPSFTQLIEALADAWATKRDELEGQADTLSEAITRSAPLEPDAPAPELVTIDEAVLSLAHAADAQWGGFGVTPKFPQPASVDLLLRHARRTGSDTSLSIARSALDHMATGGMWDHIGGGFARYSTDRQWLVPHFEKMAYDNALLIRPYLHAWQLTGEDRYRQIVEETIAYLLDELRLPAGAFASAQDADSPDPDGADPSESDGLGVEGRFATWTPAELVAVLGEDGGAKVAAYWGITEEGNFEGRSIPHRIGHIDELQRDPALDEVRAGLLKIRRARPQPSLDDKVLVEWNALIVASLAEAAAALDRPEWGDAAVEAAEFLLGHLHRDGRWHRSWSADSAQASHRAVANDLAALVEALIRLAEWTGERRWETEALAVADELLNRYLDAETGTLWTTPDDGEALVARPRDVVDGATPSANSVAAGAFLRLAAITGATHYADAARRIIAALSPLADGQAGSFAHLLAAAEDDALGLSEIVISGERADLVAEVRRHWLPGAVLAWGEPGDSPLWEGRDEVGEQGRAYVCRGSVCEQPVTTTEDLRHRLLGH